MNEIDPKAFIKEIQMDEDINPAKLDVECVRQPGLAFKWAQRAAQALAARDRLKTKRDLVESRLELSCRKNPEDFGLAKVTESSVTAAVRCHPEYIKADDAYNNATEIKNIMDAAVQKMKSRDGMLRLLISLFQMEYFAGPSVPHDLISDWAEYQNGVSKSVTEKQKKRTRKRRVKSNTQ